MKNILILLGFLLLSTSVIQSQIQRNNLSQNPTSKKYIYHYTFENASSEEKVKAAESSLKNLLHVTEVKYQYKAESQRGQFIITVVEQEIRSESQELFSPKMVKEVILQNGLDPIEFTVSEEILN